MSGCDISVIIPVYRDWDTLRGCLDALAGQTMPAERFEIVIVNNDPASGPPPGFALPANARVITEAAPGSYAARNAGVAASAGTILCFTDADCLPAPDWLETAARWLGGGAAGAARIGGPIDLFSREAEPNIYEIYEQMTGFRQDRSVAGCWSATANMCTRRSAFDAVGPFDTALMSGGDREWGERAGRLGVPITYVADLRVAHPARASFAALAAKVRRIEGGKVSQALRKRSRRGMALRSLVTAPLRVLPSLGEFRRVMRQRDYPLATRFRVMGIVSALRVVRIRERLVLTLFDTSPQRS